MQQKGMIKKAVFMRRPKDKKLSVFIDAVPKDVVQSRGRTGKGDAIAKRLVKGGKRYNSTN
jgi:hypothetical protein